MVLDEKDLEIVAISISMAAGCIPCTKYHINKSKNLNATADEVDRAVAIGAYVSRVAAGEMENIFNHGPAVNVAMATRTVLDRIPLLCTIGAAVACNCVGLTKVALEAGRSGVLNDTEIMEVVGLAGRIREKAASHIEPLVALLDADPEIARNVVQVCT